MKLRWRDILKDVYRGSSVNRALLHQQVGSRVSLRGMVLDVGGGHRNTYVEHMNIRSAKGLIVVDLQPSPLVNVVGSVTNMPIRSESFDIVLCFNLLEHVFDYESALAEIRRVMKPGATLYGWVPFTIGVHGDPQDYWRYTPDTLGTLLSGAGLSKVAIIPSGDAFLAGFDLVRPYIRFWFIGSIVRVVCAWFALVASLTVQKLAPRGVAHPDSSPLGIWFEAMR